MASMILKGEIVAIQSPKRVGFSSCTKKTHSLDPGTVVAEAKLAAMELLNGAKDEGEKITRKAEQRAEEILEKAEKEREALKQQAETKGYTEGVRRAEQEIETEREGLIKERSRLEREIRQQRVEMIAGLEPEIVELSLKIAKKLLHAELELDHEQVVNIVEAVFSKVADLEEFTIRVSPDDHNIICEQGEIGVPGGKMELEMDPSLSKGDCVADTPFGTVDGTIDGQLAEIKRHFSEVAGDG